MANTTFDDNDKGVLFPVTEKKNEKGPDFTGNITVGGKKYRLSAWSGVSGSGRPYTSLRLNGEWTDEPPGRNSEAPGKTPAPSLFD